MRRMLFIALTCAFAASPAMADLFQFHFDGLSSLFDGSKSFSATTSASSDGSVDRLVAPTGSAKFDGSINNSIFSISMTITDITENTAGGFGSFTITDRDDDMITANVVGQWTKPFGTSVFVGGLSQVDFTPSLSSASDTEFNGDSGSLVSMVFGSPAPWSGTLLQLTTGGEWFTPNTPFSNGSGMVMASVVPVPAAVLLGMLGLAAAGLKLRRCV